MKYLCIKPMIALTTQKIYFQAGLIYNLKRSAFQQYKCEKVNTVWLSQAQIKKHFKFIPPEKKHE